LSVHIPAGEHYPSTLSTLNENNVDFTKVEKVNRMIATDTISGRKRRIHFFGFLKPLMILNTLFPWLLWKYVDKKNDEIEFVDTFRFGFNTILFPIFYLLQTYIVSIFFGWKIAGSYFVVSLLIVLIYSKTHPTPTE
jgi:hypothetical protein